ncbi:hypothetical protein PILCRDRAFT_817036 [Piloderma croceum F 1598]|uniref:NADAR domain-containing protein n=1 Tax=Piloderma croceum (strain F 1598) TaxID=765440 RepID=A0A0C3G598_PILCF|nr:hypothetical protein PILCRDRAFT_817036 [Piloderma croceum F 1598]
MARTNYVFFWKMNTKNDWGSQWYPSSFTSPVTFPPSPTQPQPETVSATFPTAEHWMMTQKAILFGDAETAKQVLAIKGSKHTDCSKVKAMGRKVKNFDEKVWVRERERIVLEGTLLKFRHNPNLRHLLDATGDKMIVEASPLDKIWGIGLGEKGALEKGEEGWRGLNLLGKALMQARTILREEAKSEVANAD